MSTNPNMQDIVNPPLTLGVATIDGTVPAGNLPVGNGSDQVAAGNDPRLTNAPRVVPNIAVALRALPAPVAGVDGGHLIAEGYYAPGDGGGGKFYWDPAFTYLQPVDATMGAGGSGYHVHDLLQLAGGVSYSDPITGTPAFNNSGTMLVDVLSVAANGAVVSYAVLPGSSYASLPTGPQATTLRHSEGGTHTPSGATFTIMTTTLEYDDGGACVCPNGYTGAGRWRRIIDPDAARNVLCWGARFANITDTQATDVDSYDAINAAIASLPNDDFSAQDYPGAGRTGHQKAGEIFFPPSLSDPNNNGFEVRNTIYLSCKMKLRGVKDHSILAFTSNVAPAGGEKWLVQTLYSGSTNETFSTTIEGLHLNTRPGSGNPGSSGLYFVGCNGAKLTDVFVDAAGLRGVYADVSGAYVNNVGLGQVSRGPGITFTGILLVAGFLDAEKVNGYSAVGDPTIHYDSSDSNHDPYPAVLLTNLRDATLTHIQGEGSVLPLKVFNCINVAIGQVTAHSEVNFASDQINAATAAPVRMYGSDHVSIEGIDETNQGQWPFMVYDHGGSGIVVGYVNDGGGLRGSYRQNEYTVQSVNNNVTVLNNLNFSGAFHGEAVDQPTVDQLTQLGAGNTWIWSRQGAGRPSPHTVFSLDYNDNFVVGYGLITPQITLGGNDLATTLAGKAASPVVQTYASNANGIPAISGSPARYVLLVNPGPSSCTVHLPLAATYAAGAELRVVDAKGWTTSNKVTFTAASGDTLNGAAVLNGPGVLVFYSDGANAWVSH